MAEFFIPGEDDPTKAEEVFARIRKSKEEQLGATLADQRFYKIDYYHDGKRYVATVGELEQVDGEIVVCILLDTRRSLYYVCTPNRGVVTGIPIHVGSHDTNSIQEFD